MKRALPGLLFGLLLLAVYADPLFARRMFSGRDLIAYNHPLEKAIHDAYGRGRLPVWMSEVSGGRPLLPNPNAGALYPVRALLSLIPFPAATRVFPVLHWFVAGLGMLALLDALNVSRPGAWVGAVTYAFSGVGVGLVFFPNLQPGMSLLPWVVWAVARRQAAGSSGVIVLAAILSFDILAGDVFTAGMAVLAAGLWALLETSVSERVRVLSGLAAALVLSAVATAPLWLASLLWAPLTVRAVSGMTLVEVLGFAVSPWRLLEFLVPFPFGATWALDATTVWGDPAFQGRPTGMFDTLYAGAFAVVACVSAWRSRTPGARFARAFLLLGLLFTVPASLLPASWGRIPSPLPLRNPEKFAVMIAFALALFAGFGLDTLRTRGRRPWMLALGGALAAAALAAALFPQAAAKGAVGLLGADPALTGIARAELPGALAEGALLWMLTLVAIDLLPRAGAIGPAAALALLTVVPLAANRRAARSFREDAILSPTVFARRIAALDTTRSFRVFGGSLLHGGSDLTGQQLRSDIGYIEFPRRGWFQYTQTLWSGATVFNMDYDRGDFSRLDSLRKLVVEKKRLPNPPPLFSSLSLRWEVRYRDQPLSPGFRRFGGDAFQDWDENAGALPDVRWVARWREARSAPEALGLLPGLAPGELVLETGRRGAGESSGGSVRVLEKTPERLTLEAEAGEAGWLFVLRGYWPYREVLVDGREAEVVPAHLAFSAVAVPAGRHRVEWREKIPGLEVSGWGPVLFVLAAALMRMRERAAASRARQAPPPEASGR